MHATAQKEAGFRILSDDYNALRIEFTPGTLQEGKTTLAGETFSTLAIEGYQQPLDCYGSPALPTFSQLIEVPLCQGFDVEVTDATYDTLPALEHRLVPVQLPRRKSDTSAFKLFISEVYSWNHFLGQREALVEAVGVARDRNIARLQFSPVRYNPVSGQVIVCRHATVTVRYRNADVSATQEMFTLHHSPAFNSGIKTINNLYPKAVRTTAPVRYLIVAHSMFRGQLDNFVNWKKRKGFLVDVAYTNDPGVGTDTTSISNYIKSQYTNATLANPAPTYVLLVGDVAQIPNFIGHVSSPSTGHVTDLYYSTWTNGDHIPDCHYGRFSAQNVSQLTPQIEKTLMYEQYTFPDPSFLDRAVMVAGVDGGTAGDYGYTHADPTMDYAVTNYVNGAHGWSQVMYFKNNTSIVPAGVTNVTVGSSASSNAATVRNYYNQGAGFINYTAHGGSTGWGTPNFGNTHVNSMTNNRKFGLMIGNCCQTNMFGESCCFGEALLRKGDYAGAVGYIGGSNYTYWGQDVYWAMGVRSNISATMSMAYDAAHLGVYDRTFHTHGESYADWCTTQGSILMQGGMAVESSSSGSDMKWYYWEIYHLMGDPSVMPYMTQPDTMNIAVATILSYGAATLPVTAAPNAYVALTDTVTNTLLAAGYADANGDVMLTLPTDMFVGTYRLVASAQQYRTAFRNIRVIQPTGPFPIVTSITSAPLNAGDTVDLTLHVENPGNQTAHNISIQLSSNNPMLTFSNSTVTLDSLANDASVDLAAVVSAYVSDNTADNSFADVNITITYTDNTTPITTNIRLWLYAPVLHMTFSNEHPTMQTSGSLTLTATLRNSGHAPTHYNPLTFATPMSLLSVDLAATAPFVLGVDEDTTFTITLTDNFQLTQNTTIPLEYGFGPFNGSLPVFIGQEFFENFEEGTTHIAGWDFPAAYPWAISSEDPYEGSYCLRSAQYIGHSQNSDMSIVVTVASADSVSFYYRVSSEENYDKFHFLIDDESQFNASGTVEWTRASFPLSAGTHTLTFRYAKDYSVSNGSDCAWIDNVSLPHESHATSFVQRETCVGSSPITIAGHSFPATEAGSGSGSIVAANGDVTYYEYEIHPTFNTNDVVTACDSYLLNGVEYTASTTLNENLQTVYGCDSTIHINLTVNHSTMGDTTTVTTLTETYVWYGTTYNVSGIYQHAFTNTQGCDSIVFLNLTIPGTQFVQYEVCQGDPLTIAGQNFPTDVPGSYSGSVVDTGNVIVFYEYEVHPAYNTTDTVTACDSYIWRGVEYTASASLTDSRQTIFGCDSIDGLLLTVNHSSMVDTLNVTTSDSTYEWHGEVYNTSGTYQYVFTNAQGCDSMVVLNLNIHRIDYVHRELCLGDALTIAGQTFPTDVPGVFSDSIIITADYIIIYEYIVHPVYTAIDTVTACDSYLWQGMEYTSSVTRIDSLQSNFGCDSVVGIALTMNHSTMGDTITVTTLAETYVWYGNVYNTSGTYQQVLTNAQGCDSTIVLVLTIGHNEGIEDIDATSLTIYPNPTAGEVHLGTLVSEAVVYNMLGQEVMRRRDVQTLDLTPLPQGVYMLRLTLSGGSATQRIVKQ